MRPIQVFMLAAALAAQPAAAQGPSPGEATTMTNRASDFDFLLGRWNLRPLHLVAHHAHLLPLGTGVLARWRQELGDELDHGAQPPGGGGENYSGGR
jgi:hypothetical protein